MTPPEEAVETKPVQAESTVPAPVNPTKPDKKEGKKSFFLNPQNNRNHKMQNTNKKYSFLIFLETLESCDSESDCMFKFFDFFPNEFFLEIIVRLTKKRRFLAFNF